MSSIARSGNVKSGKTVWIAVLLNADINLGGGLMVFVRKESAKKVVNEEGHMI
jgi:hypothetical protein